MLFSELYGAYYNCVADLLKIAVRRPVTSSDIVRISKAKGFAETALALQRAFREEEYKLIRKDGTTPVTKEPSMPLTTLQKMWLRSVTLDPRFMLFGETIEGLEDVPPLFTSDDYDVYDSYADGDPFTDPSYIENFRRVLDAVRNKKTLEIVSSSGRGRTGRIVFRPDMLEYSEKDDKFRAVGMCADGPRVVNINRIKSIADTDESVTRKPAPYKNDRKVTFTLRDTRNALERVMFHFSHLQKEVKRTGKSTYEVTLCYDKDDETELLIRLLSFGPMIRVTSPDAFIDLMRDRIRKQSVLFEN
ncbi:MAG: WYL domain-containing protein [Clostridiales bacterium]|nr:WYL domain-containing protein [Clostridiales bacterium]